MSTCLRLIAAALLTAAANVYAEPKVSDLAWMTGSWSGPAGPGTELEENWSAPRAGTMASIVRMVGKTTSMIEIVYIEEREGTLMLYLQQWNPGFEPRTEEPQVMRLESTGARSVKFEAIGGGSMKALGYSRPTDDSFVIDVTLANGNAVKIPLQRLRQ